MAGVVEIHGYEKQKKRNGSTISIPFVA